MYTILCPTDFSTGARRAAEFAADLAKAWNAPLVLVHAYEVPQSENLAAARLLEEVKALTEESLLREAKRLEGTEYKFEQKPCTEIWFRWSRTW